MTTLADNEIIARIKVGELIRNGQDEQVGPACYELRMGSIYYDLTESDKRIDATPQGTILIKPGHRVVLITLEELNIPNNVIARVSSKGSLFSIGLTAVNTYADPGFKGNLGVVTQNTSDKYITLPIGEPIAKIDFSILSRNSTHPYQGQHGFKTQIWPIRHHLQKTYAEVKGDPRVGCEDDEAYRILPTATANALKNIRNQQLKINYALLLALVVNALILAMVSTKILDTIVSVVVNLLSSAIIAALMWFKKDPKE